MSRLEKPLVYIFLGAAGSGRREVLADLIEGGLLETDRPAVLLSAAESPSPAEAKLPRVERWEWRDEIVVANLPAGATHVFFVTDGTRNPVDQIEVLKPW